jgi:hypothetical protein
MSHPEFTLQIAAFVLPLMVAVSVMNRNEEHALVKIWNDGGERTQDIMHHVCRFSQLEHTLE